MGVIVKVKQNNESTMLKQVTNKQYMSIIIKMFPSCLGFPKKNLNNIN